MRLKSYRDMQTLNIFATFGMTRKMMRSTCQCFSFSGTSEKMCLSKPRLGKMFFFCQDVVVVAAAVVVAVVCDGFFNQTSVSNGALQRIVL